MILEKKAKERLVDLGEIQAYLDAFKYGCPPHAGGGIGEWWFIMVAQLVSLHSLLFRARACGDALPRPQQYPSLFDVPA